MSEQSQSLTRDKLQEIFDEKRHYNSIREAFPDKREAHKMSKLFKAHGIIQGSWKRSCGLLKTSNPEYSKRWREKNKDKVIAYNTKYSLLQYGCMEVPSPGSRITGIPILGLAVP